MSAPTDSRHVPLLAAVAIVAGNMIGTGIFASLGYQVAAMPSAFVVLLLWVLGGVIAFCGAVNYAELAAAFPRSGGEYQLLSRVYHPGVGFVAGWISLVAGFSAPVAAAALVFGAHLTQVTGWQWPLAHKFAAAGLVAAVTAGHLVSVRFSGRFQWMATGFKVLLLVMLAVCGFVLADRQPAHFLPREGDSNLIWQAAFYVNLIYVFYTYSGWNAACYIASEVKDPERNVPRALLLGTALVTLIYLAVNAAMLWAVPMDQLARGGEHLGFLMSIHTFGETGGRIVAALIACGLASAVSAMTWAGPRVNQQMGLDYPFLRVLARTNAGGVPWISVLLQSTLALALIFMFDVRAIMSRTTFLLQIVLLLTVFGVIYLRVKAPALPRPCRAWGYPWTTIVFLVMVGLTLAFIQTTQPDDARWGLGILAIGIAFYFVVRTPAKND